MSLRSDILKLAHDVSNEARDNNGRWINSGSSDKSESNKLKNKSNRKSSIAKRIAKKAALVGAAYSGGVVAAGTYLKKTGAPISNKAIAKISGIAGVAGATIGGSVQGYREFEKKDPNAAKKVALTTLATGTVLHAQHKYRDNLPNKVHRQMVKEIFKHHQNIVGKSVDLKSLPRGLNKSKSRELIINEAKKVAYKYQDEVIKNLRVPNKSIDRLAKMIHVEDKFINAPLKQRIRIAKVIRSRVGVRSFAEHIKHIASKVINKFKPLKVVKIAGLLK